MEEAGGSVGLARRRPWRRATLFAACVGSVLGLSSGVLAQTPSLTLLGLPAGRSDSFATGLSADGRTVVGYNRDQTRGDLAFRWTREGGFEEFGSTPGVPIPTQATGVSADGSVVVGHSSSNGLLRASAFRYSGGVYQNLGNAPGDNKAQAFGVSGDASVIVGSTGIVGAPLRAMRWTPATGMQNLGLPRVGDIGGWFTGVSRDGSTAIGISGGSTAATFDPFTWTQAGGWRQLPVPSGLGNGYDARPFGSNFNGSIIVGSLRPGNAPESPLLWRDGILATLNSFGPNWNMAASGVSDFGTVIVGSGGDLDNSGRGSAAIWLNSESPQNLQDYLASLGVTTPDGFRLAACRGVSADGNTIIGLAQSGANFQTFIATIPMPGPLAIGSVFSVILLRRRRIKASQA